MKRGGKENYSSGYMIIDRIKGIHDANRSICLKFYQFLNYHTKCPSRHTFDKYPSQTTEQVFIELSSLCSSWLEHNYALKND